MPRFVIQEHRKQDEPTHWDLMLEQGEALKTYRLDLPPGEVVHQPATATPIADHNKRFLTYEGPVQQGAGQVRIVDRGTYRSAERREDRWELALSGGILKGNFTLTRTEGDAWLFALEESEERR